MSERERERKRKEERERKTERKKERKKEREKERKRKERKRKEERGISLLLQRGIVSDSIFESRIDLLRDYSNWKLAC